MMKEVCDYFGVKVDDIQSLRRERKIVYAKKVICYVLRMRGLSLNQIGRYVNKDHQTVFNAIKTIPPEIRKYAQSIYKKMSALSLEAENKIDMERKTKIMDLLNKNYTLGQIVQETGWCKDYIQEQIDYFILNGWYKKVPNYKTGEVLIRFFKK